MRACCEGVGLSHRNLMASRLTKPHRFALHLHVTSSFFKGPCFIKNKTKQKKFFSLHSSTSKWKKLSTTERFLAMNSVPSEMDSYQKLVSYRTNSYLLEAVTNEYHRHFPETTRRLRFVITSSLLPCDQKSQLRVRKPTLKILCCCDS